MKHCRVPGSAARCVISSSTGHGLLSRSSLARHAELAAAGRRHGFTTCQTRTSSNKTPKPDLWTTTDGPLPPSIHPHSSSSPAEQPVPMGEQLRHMMRLLPHSVLVCTSLSGPDGASSSSPRPRQQPRGMTVSSFTSLSLAPALVTFHVAAPSRTLDAVRATRLLNLHVLAGDARGARVAHHFTGGNTARTWSRRTLAAAGLAVRGGGGDDAVSTTRGGEEKEPVVEAVTEPPVLHGPGVMYVLRCKLFEEAAAGGIMMVRDHAVVVAEVVDIVEASEKTETDDGREQFGLVYADRHYRLLGKTLVRRDADAGAE